MKNKYQEALDNLKTHLEYGFPEDDELMCERCMEEVNTLQKLINNYDGSLKLCVMLIKENANLETALDNACDILEGYAYTTNNELVEDDAGTSKEMWKKSLLKKERNNGNN